MLAGERSAVLLLLLLLRPSPFQVMASSLPGVTAWSGGTSSASNKDCVQVETGSGGLTVRCSGLRLTQVRNSRAYLLELQVFCLRVPGSKHESAVSHVTAGCCSRLPVSAGPARSLQPNLLPAFEQKLAPLSAAKILLWSPAAPRAGSVQQPGAPMLQLGWGWGADPPLKHCLLVFQLSTLEPGCFYGLEDSLRLLDLSSNRLSWLEPQAFAGLQVQVNFTHNPWHCDCSMQVSPTCAGEGARAAHMLMTSYLDADVRVSDGSGSIFSRESGVPDIRHPKRWWVLSPWRRCRGQTVEL